MNTKSIFLLCMWLFATCFLQAQDKMPQAVSYQAVARDAQGKVVAQKPIGIQVEILKGSTTGTVVFSETHSPTSSKTGTVNLLIGQGTRKTGTFSSVDWGADTYYLQLSMDLNGGSNYEKVSTTQMLPVPYALYAAKAGTVENGGSSGSTSTTVDFAVIPDDSEIMDLSEIIAGKNPKLSSCENFFEGYVIYLNGEDQEVEFTVDGLPEDSYELEVSSSSKNGRYINCKEKYIYSEGGSFNYALPKGSYNVTFTLQNKYGLKKEYKCTIVRE